MSAAACCALGLLPGGLPGRLVTVGAGTLQLSLGAILAGRLSLVLPGLAGPGLSLGRLGLRAGHRLVRLPPHLAADEQRTRQVTADILAALSKDRNCLVLTNRTSHLERFAGLLREAGHDPVILRGGMGAKSRAAALARLQPQPGGPPLLAVATGPYAGEGFDCPALDTLFLAAPVANKGSLTQYVGRILRSHEPFAPYPRRNTGWSSAPGSLVKYELTAPLMIFR